MVENTKLVRLEPGNHGQIRWCPDAIRAMYAHLAARRPNLQTCQTVGLDTLLRKLNCVHDGSSYSALVNPRVQRKLRSLMGQLIDHQTLIRHDDGRSITWPEWTRAWALPGWSGDIHKPPGGVAVIDLTDDADPVAPVLSADVTSWGPRLQTSHFAPAPCLSSGELTTTHAPTFVQAPSRGPGRSRSSGASTTTYEPTLILRGASGQSSGASTTTYEPTLVLHEPPANHGRDPTVLTSMSTTTYEPTFIQPPGPSQGVSLPSSGLSTSSYNPTLVMSAAPVLSGSTSLTAAAFSHRGLAASRFNPERDAEAHSIHPSESASVAHLSSRRQRLAPPVHSHARPAARTSLQYPPAVTRGGETVQGHERGSDWINVRSENHDLRPQRGLAPTRLITPSLLTPPSSAHPQMLLPSPPPSPHAVARRLYPGAMAFKAFPTIHEAPMDQQPSTDRAKLRREELERAVHELALIQLSIVSRHETELLLAINAVESDLRTVADRESGGEAFHSAQKTARELVILCRSHDASDSEQLRKVRSEVTRLRQALAVEAEVEAAEGNRSDGDDGDFLAGLLGNLVLNTPSA